MNNLQLSSLKIHKLTPKISRDGERNYVCGGCQSAYKSYPALYLHIKRKHMGIKPPNTKTHCAKNLPSPEKIPTGRPQKATFDIDNIPKDVQALEVLENELFGLLGDYLKVISPLNVKPDLDKVILGLGSHLENTEDEYLGQIREQIKLFTAYKAQEQALKGSYELDYETVAEKGPTDPKMILTWFLLWFGRHQLKSDFLPDLCFIFSRIWKVVTTKNLRIQNLSNKQVWNEIYNECQTNLPNLVYFKKKEFLLVELLKKLCQFIGKTYEIQKINVKTDE